MTEQTPRTLPLALQIATGTSGAYLTVHDETSRKALARIELTHEQLGKLLSGSRVVADGNLITEAGFARVGQASWQVTVTMPTDWADGQGTGVDPEFSIDALRSHLSIVLADAPFTAEQDRALYDGARPEFEGTEDNGSRISVTARGYAETREMAAALASVTAQHFATWMDGREMAPRQKDKTGLRWSPRED